MLTYILIPAIAFCIFQIIVQNRKMNKIERQYKDAKSQQNKKN